MWWMVPERKDLRIGYYTGYMEEGTHMTLDFCWEQGRPVLLVDTKEIEQDPATIRRTFGKWITENKIEVLNVAGNRESNCPGLQKKIPEILALIGQMS